MMIRPHEVILLRHYDVILAGRAIDDVIISKATSIYDITEGLICGFSEN